MKTMKFFCFALAISITPLFASQDPIQSDHEGDPTYEKAKENLTKEIYQLLRGPNLKRHGIDPCKVNVHFVINNSRQIRVIDIFTDNRYLKNFIESRLDNARIRTKNITLRKSFLIPVKFKV